jgi:hypothetical protein
VDTQFSPDLVDLPSFLQALVTNSGNRPALHAAIWSPPVHLKRSGIPPSTRNANLPLEAAVQYGLLEAGTHRATGLSQHLAKMQTPELYEEFARHILLHLGGLRVVEAAQQMKLDGQPITGDKLARYLDDQGFHVVVRALLNSSGHQQGSKWTVNVGLMGSVSAAFKGGRSDDPALRPPLKAATVHPIAVDGTLEWLMEEQPDSSPWRCPMDNVLWSPPSSDIEPSRSVATRLSLEKITNWLGRYDALAVALGIDPARTISAAQISRRIRQLGLRPYRFFFLGLVGVLLRLGTRTGRHVILDGSLLKAG